jgi:hypothetical protein
MLASSLLRLLCARLQKRAILCPFKGKAPVAQLDRALVSETKGQRFESSRVHHFNPLNLEGLWRLANWVIEAHNRMAPRDGVSLRAILPFLAMPETLPSATTPSASIWRGNFALYRQVLLVWAMELVLARWTSDRQSLLDCLVSLAGLGAVGLVPFLLSKCCRGLLSRLFFALALAAPLVVVCAGVLAVPAMTTKPIFGVVAVVISASVISLTYLWRAWRKQTCPSWLSAAFLASSVFCAWWFSAGAIAPLSIWAPLLLAWAVFAWLASSWRKSSLLYLALLAAFLPSGGLAVTWSEHLPAASLESPDIVLLCLDTLRADVAANMTIYQQIHQQGVEFQNVQAAGPWTLPTMATVMTSLPPWSHGAGTGSDWIPRGLSVATPTLAEFAQQNGYDTAALVHNPVLAPSFGFARGFQIWDSASMRTTWGLPRTRKALEARPSVAHFLSLVNLLGRRSFQSAEELATRARQVISGRRDRPLLLWVHMLDCHFPYRHADQMDLPFHRQMQLERGDSE